VSRRPPALDREADEPERLVYVDAEVLRLRLTAREATIERVGRTRALLERGEVRPRPCGFEGDPTLCLAVDRFGLLPRVDGSSWV